MSTVHTESASLCPGHGSALLRNECPLCKPSITYVPLPFQCFDCERRFATEGAREAHWVQEHDKAEYEPIGTKL